MPSDALCRRDGDRCHRRPFKNNEGPRLDMQIYELPETFAGQTLVRMTVTDSGNTGGQRSLLAALTVSTAAPWTHASSGLDERGYGKVSCAKKPQSRAGWPGFFPFWNEFDNFLSTTQNLEKRSQPRLTVSALFCAAPGSNSRFVEPSQADSQLDTRMLVYITSARFSNSYCRTGSAHPAISTRPAASSAAFGETPYPRPIKNT
jgi:hypothetical protein